MCSTGRLTVKCLEIRELWYVAYMLAYASVPAPHHMPDHGVTLAWHTRPHKIRSQIRELTCEVWHVYNWRGLGANVGIFLGIHLWYISPLYITFRFDTCMEHLIICHMHF